MISIFLVPFLLVPTPQTEAPDQVITSFAHYLNRGEIQEAVARVQGGKFTYPARRLETIVKRIRRPIPMLELVSVERPKIDGNTATVSLRSKVFGYEEPVVQEIELRFADDRWRIVPKPLDAQKSPDPSKLTNTWALACSDGAVMQTFLTVITQQASGAAVKSPSGKDMAQFTSFTMLYAAMFDDTLPKDTDALRSGVRPMLEQSPPELAKHLDELVKTREGITLRINPNLLGVSLLKVKQPEKTVLAYEEEGEEVSFRHEGKALLAFTDGVIRLVTRDESMNIFWLPE